MKSGSGRTTLFVLNPSPELLAALLLVLFPLPLVWGRAVTYRALHSNWDRFLARVPTWPWHWVDLGRAVAGMLLLRSALQIEWKPAEPIAKENLWLWAGVIVLAPLVQSILCRERDAFLAPFVTVGAIVALGYPPIVAGLSLVTAIAVALAFRSASMFFWTAGLSIPLFGFYFYPEWIPLGAGMIAAILPALAVMLFHREFVLALAPSKEPADEGHGELR